MLYNRTHKPVKKLLVVTVPSYFTHEELSTMENLFKKKYNSCEAIIIASGISDEIDIKLL